ncbi:hypothetical protein [Halopiger djelfimassiliensis]|uniref:hypothetical protein n=1 Tax=Halopiger djelfimassiliensis TaxID=1293047 RepID=UPI0006781426|nr:hypothetical protein [Halopiger djelfimassiliensis]
MAKFQADKLRELEQAKNSDDADISVLAFAIGVEVAELETMSKDELRGIAQANALDPDEFDL